MLKELEVDVFTLLPHPAYYDAESAYRSTCTESVLSEMPRPQSTNEPAPYVVPRLLDILPSSIECLVLGIRSLEQQASQLFRDFAADKSAQLPNLSRVVWRCSEGAEVDRLERELVAVGITVERRAVNHQGQDSMFWTDLPDQDLSDRNAGG